MTIGELGSIGELVGALATVATLAYLAIQIRANTRTVRVTAAQSVHGSFSDWYRMIASDGELAEITASGLRDYDQLSERDRTRFMAMAMSFLLLGQDAFTKFREGSLQPDLWTAWEQVLTNMVVPPGGRAFWNERAYLFGPEFRDYVENVLLERARHPAAKAAGVVPLDREPS